MGNLVCVITHRGATPESGHFKMYAFKNGKFVVVYLVTAKGHGDWINFLSMLKGFNTPQTPESTFHDYRIDSANVFIQQISENPDFPTYINLALFLWNPKPDA